MFMVIFCLFLLTTLILIITRERLKKDISSQEFCDQNFNNFFFQTYFYHAQLKISHSFEDPAA